MLDQEGNEMEIVLFYTLNPHLHRGEQKALLVLELRFKVSNILQIYLFLRILTDLSIKYLPILVRGDIIIKLWCSISYQLVE
jgi:hypothetical protein